MIKSKHFWIAAIIIALIPLLVIDIAQHYVDWQKEVREELINVVQTYSLDRAEKADLLDRVFSRNETLTFLFYTKCFSILVLLLLSFHFFRSYYRNQKPNLFKSFFFTITLIVCFISVKLFLFNKVIINEKIKFLTFSDEDSTFNTLYNENFKGKVVYVDFWGTTCGPCLDEFRNFTKPLKDKYKNRNDINYLYVGQGNRYLWREQIKKYKIEGHHIFLNSSQYNKLYIQSAKDSLVLMPRYLIIDKKGNITETNAKRPSNKDSLHSQIDKYLIEK